MVLRFKAVIDDPELQVINTPFECVETTQMATILQRKWKPWQGAVIMLLLVILLQARFADSSSAYEFPGEALPTRSGYLHVNTATASRLFFAYYEAIEATDALSDTPVVLWLQGGPGCSGLIGNFGELGPWRVESDMKLHKNSYPWNRLYGLLFIDSPAGTGFSVFPSPDAITTNEHDVARDLYEALVIFFSEEGYSSRPLYVTGESYGGKYVPALGYYVVSMNEQRLRLNSEPPLFELQGVAIGNGFTHPVVQVLTYGATAFYMGLVDQEQKQVLDDLAKKSVECILKEDWLGAVAARSNLMRSLHNMSGLATLEDIRKSADYFTFANSTDYLTPFVNIETVKEALGADVNITWSQCDDLVDEKMQIDIMKSTKWMVEALLPKLSVLLYQGQFDIQDGVASNEAWMRTIVWENVNSFWAAERKVWKEEGKLAGYVRTHGNLGHVVVAGAGHLAPADQNLRTQRMQDAWISGKLGTL